MDEFVVDENFSYEGYQIAREEFFAHAREPSLTINRNHLYANKVCFRKAPDALRILVLVNATRKKIILKPCPEEKKDSIPWITPKGNMRHISCKPAFCAMLSELTGWDLNNRYKMIGKLVRNQDDRLFIFDLNSALIFPRKTDFDGNGHMIRNRIVREPVYLESWRHQFGLPVEEHERSYAINRFEDYVIVNVQETHKKPEIRPELNREEN